MGHWNFWLSSFRESHVVTYIIWKTLIFDYMKRHMWTISQWTLTFFKAKNVHAKSLIQYPIGYQDCISYYLLFVYFLGKFSGVDSLICIDIIELAKTWWATDETQHRTPRSGPWFVGAVRWTGLSIAKKGRTKYS